MSGGRWNPPGRAVIYLAGSYAAGLLENLIRLGFGTLPPQTIVGIAEWPVGLKVTRHEVEGLEAGWDVADYAVGQRIGRAWLASGRSAILDVPSIVGRPYERTIVIDPAHPDAKQVVLGAPTPVEWDTRLFARHGA